MSGFKKFGYDLLPVTAGVLLALFISNTQQSWKQQQFANQIIQNIIEENRTNIKNIEDLLPKQERTLDSLSYYVDSTSVALVDIIQKMNGLSAPDIINNASEFLLKGNQTVIEVDMLMKLAEINEAIDNFDVGFRLITSGLYNDLYSKNPNDKRKLRLLLNDVMNYEKTVKVLSEEFNEEYSKEE